MSLGTLDELAARVAGIARGDGALVIERIAAIDEASQDALTFATSAAYFEAALKSRAAAVLVDAELVQDGRPAAKPLILVESARVALMQLLRDFERPRKRGPFRHPSAVVDETAAVGQDVYIGPHVAVGPRSRIGDGAYLECGCSIGEDARIGASAVLHAQARVMDACIVGDRVVLHAGATVGSEGFGFVFFEGAFHRIPQIGNVVLEDDVEIGANTCIDRAQTGSTRIGRGTKIDNLCQIGHNCRIGAHNGIAAQTGLAGSTTLGDYVLVGGQVGFKGHITIGSRVKIAGGAGVWSDIPDDAFVGGSPARPQREELRREVMVRNLPKLVSRVDALEKLCRNANRPDDEAQE